MCLPTCRALIYPIAWSQRWVDNQAGSIAHHMGVSLTQANVVSPSANVRRPLRIAVLTTGSTLFFQSTLFNPFLPSATSWIAGTAGAMILAPPLAKHLYFHVKECRTELSQQDLITSVAIPTLIFSVYSFALLILDTGEEHQNLIRSFSLHMFHFSVLFGMLISTQHLLSVKAARLIEQKIEEECEKLTETNTKLEKQLSHFDDYIKAHPDLMDLFLQNQNDCGIVWIENVQPDLEGLSPIEKRSALQIRNRNLEQSKEERKLFIQRHPDIMNGLKAHMEADRKAGRVHEIAFSRLLQENPLD